jgi:hypothetical protein
MKRSTLLKNWSDEAFNASSLHRSWCPAGDKEVAHAIHYYIKER